MVFIDDKHCYPDIEAVWKEMCQMRCLEGVGALLEGLRHIRMDLFWQEQIVTSDLTMRFFDQRVNKLEAYRTNESKEIDWLKELALIVYLRSSMALREYNMTFPDWPLELLKVLFIFFRDNYQSAREDEELCDEISSMAMCCVLQIQSKKVKIPKGLTFQLCEEVVYRAGGIDDSTKDYYRIAPFIIKDMLNNAHFFGTVPKGGWTTTTILDYCEPNGYFPRECALIRTWLRNKKVRNLLAKEIGL